MNLIRTNRLAAIGRVSLFVAIGALLGYVQMRLEAAFDDENLELLPGLIIVLSDLFLVPCLTIFSALASWKFAIGDTYWKGPALYFLIALSGVLMLLFLLPFIPDFITDRLLDGGAQLRAFIETRPSWGVIVVGVVIIIEALGIFAIFAFVIRAMIVRSGKWAGLVFLLIGTIVGSCLTVLVGSTADSLLQPPFLLGLSALAFRLLPTKSSVPTIQTHLVEAR